MRGGGQQQNPGNSNDFLWVSVMLVLCAGFVWWQYGSWIREQVLSFRIWQMQGVGIALVWIKPYLSKLTSFSIPMPADLRPAAATRLMMMLEDANPDTMSIQAFGSLNHEVGIYLRLPYTLLCALMSVFLLFFYKGNIYRRAHSMKTLRDQEARNWPYITPVLKDNLVKSDLDDPHWGMSLPPMLFAKKYELLDYVTKDGQPAVRVKKGAASRQFALQMGHLWKGLESLPPYAQALFAIFAARAEQDSKSAEKLLRQIAHSAAKGKKIDYSGTRDLLVKHIKSKHVGRAVSPHAYVLTVMASMLEMARMDGVVASSEFVWLKWVDRRMWYMLNNVGRQTAFPEVAGPYAHWLVEKRLRRPLKVPMVGEAVRALEEGIAQIKYKPEGW